MGVIIHAPTSPLHVHVIARLDWKATPLERKDTLRNHPRMEGKEVFMAFLFRFLFTNLKGIRWLLLVAIFVSITQVASDLGAAYSIKFITSKVSNTGNDPSCTFPFLETGTPGNTGILGLFDNPAFDPSLRFGLPTASQCPATPGNLQSIQSPVKTQHSVIGVIV